MARSARQSPLPATTRTTTSIITLTLNNSSESSSSSSSEQQQQHTTEILTLKLKQKKKSVSWKPGTVDNEFLNKKSSKICCIFHKEKPFDEDDSDDDENVNQSNKKDLLVQAQKLRTIGLEVLNLD
ncbi:protein phosphatase 1 regulatory subunit INH3 [Nicotiana sylvestris]|uniref:protein phosphatase 1 regulatory subunit INH3 n=1 Tax=Nicotiana sylvestris TaxID=4096 RepID=UPI00388CAAD4